MNQLGDHQMETYFNGTHGNNEGMMCQGDTTGAEMDQVFRKMDAIHNASFEDIGGTFIPREHESTCAIRLASTLFFEVRARDTNSFTPHCSSILISRLLYVAFAGQTPSAPAVRRPENSRSHDIRVHKRRHDRQKRQLLPLA